MEEIERISKGLIAGEYNTNPHKCAQDLAVLAGTYSFIMGSLETILQTKPSVWMSMRPNHKSDTACERAWQETIDGKNQEALELRAKGITQMMSALRTMIRLAESDMSNKY